MEVSIGLIAENGIQSVTIKNIAGEIGISQPAIYRHFENKFEIMNAVLDAFQDVAVDVLNFEKSRDLSALGKIEYFLLDRYRRCSENPKLAKVMFSEENFQFDKRLADKVLSIMHSHKESMHKVIVDGQKSGEIRGDIDTVSLFRIIFGAMRLLVKQWLLSGFAFDIQEEGRKLWEAEKVMVLPPDKLCTIC